MKKWVVGFLMMMSMYSCQDHLGDYKTVIYAHNRVTFIGLDNSIADDDLTVQLGVLEKFEASLGEAIAEINTVKPDAKSKEFYDKALSLCTFTKEEFISLRREWITMYIAKKANSLTLSEQQLTDRQEQSLKKYKQMRVDTDEAYSSFVDAINIKVLD